jgi:DNA-binding response OmpR family regulator
MKKILILVVDDDQTLVEFLVTVLKAAGYAVEAAFGGSQGLTKARESTPDLVILDLMMPDMHGFDVCEKIRGDDKLAEAKIMISSAKAYDVDKRAAERLGADAYVPKPFTADVLIAEVEKLVGKP